MDLFVSQQKSKLDHVAKQAAQVQEPEHVMALVIGPPELSTLPQYSPQEKENAEKKEDNCLIPEHQQWKLTKGLHNATHYRRDGSLPLWEASSGKGNKITVRKVQ